MKIDIIFELLRHTSFLIATINDICQATLLVLFIKQS